MLKKNLRAEREIHIKEEYRHSILKRAEEIFIKRGLSATTMDDIAEAAQVSKATLYRYFCRFLYISDYFGSSLVSFNLYSFAAFHLNINFFIVFKFSGNKS